LWISPAEVCQQPLPAGWQFHSYKDSPGNDIGQVLNTNGNWTQLAAACGSSPWCLGVNSNGWMKSTLLPQAQWANSFSDVCKGMLTKGRHKQQMAGKEHDTWPSPGLREETCRVNGMQCPAAFDAKPLECVITSLLCDVLFFF
jgi:hypothetical protein